MTKPCCYFMNMLSGAAFPATMPMNLVYLVYDEGLENPVQMIQEPVLAYAFVYEQLMSNGMPIEECPQCGQRKPVPFCYLRPMIRDELGQLTDALDRVDGCDNTTMVGLYGVQEPVPQAALEEARKELQDKYRRLQEKRHQLTLASEQSG